MKNREIERLRAFAVLIVMMSHLSPDLKVSMMGKHFGQGWGGVDLFFVISGFVISCSLFRLFPSFQDGESLVERIDKCRTALRIFFTKRFFRIVPLAALWVLVPLLMSVFYNKSGILYFNAMINEAFEIFSLQYNFAMAHGAPIELGYYWSLMVEEHFYLILPFFFIALASNSKRFLGSLLAIAVVMFVVHPFVEPSGAPGMRAVAMHWLSYEKFDALFGGVLLALMTSFGWMRSLARIPKYFVWPLILFSLCYVWTSPTILPSSYIDGSGMSSVWIMAFIAVSFASLEKGLVLEIPGAKTILEYLGSRSFGMYLIHRPIIWVAQETSFRLGFDLTNWLSASRGNQLLFIAAFVSATVVVADICFRLVETPFINFGARLVKSFKASELDKKKTRLEAQTQDAPAHL